MSEIDIRLASALNSAYASSTDDWQIKCYIEFYVYAVHACARIHQYGKLTLRQVRVRTAFNLKVRVETDPRIQRRPAKRQRIRTVLKPAVNHRHHQPA